MSYEEMFPYQYSLSLERQALASHIRSEIFTLFSRARTRQQLTFILDFYINVGLTDAVYFFYEMLKRTQGNEGIME